MIDPPPVMPARLRDLCHERLEVRDAVPQHLASLLRGQIAVCWRRYLAPHLRVFVSAMGQPYRSAAVHASRYMALRDLFAQSIEELTAERLRRRPAVAWVGARRGCGSVRRAPGLE